MYEQLWSNMKYFKAYESYMLILGIFLIVNLIITEIQALRMIS
jgi:hypothetical protein